MAAETPADVHKAAARRGRRPGRIDRVNCPHCGHEYAQRADGRPFSHRLIAANGYTRLGYCPGGQR